MKRKRRSVMIDFDYEMAEIAKEVISQFKNVIDEPFTEDDLLDLVYKDDSEIQKLK